MWQILVAVLVVFLVWKTWKDQIDDVSRLPGPTSYPIFGSTLKFLGLSQSQFFDALNDLPKKFGSRVYFKDVFHRYLFLYNEEDIEIVLSHSRNIKKNKMYSYLEPWLGTGLLTSCGSKYNHRRKILNPTFNYSMLKNFIAVFQEHSKHATKQLTDMITGGNGIVEVWPFISSTTLNVLCETTMGIKLNSKTESKVKYQKSVLELGHIFTARMSSLRLKFDFIYNLFPISKKCNLLVEIAHLFTTKVIRERKETYHSSLDLLEKPRLALLDLLLEAEKRGEIDSEGIREEVDTFMLAGHDAVATALTFGLMLLADHEEVQDRLYEECKAVLGGSDHCPDILELNHMKYLEAVVKEILRLYPSVPTIAREIVEDFMLDDIKVKKNTQVVISIYNVQRRPDLYPNPEAFKPERFLESETKHSFAYLPFSAGPRSCIGQRFGKLEIKCFLTEIIRNFKIEPVARGVRPKLKMDLVLRPIQPIFVKFVPRE